MDENKCRESFEKFPPDWADYEYDPDDLDDEQENKRIACLRRDIGLMKS